MPYKKSKIGLSQTQQFSQLIIDYINADPKLKPFYSLEPEISSFNEIIKNISGRSYNRQMLADVLSDQYSQRIKVPLTDSDKVISNIDLLRDKKTFTVCTGHQLCIFTGPLYFIYKIISSIKLSETLKKNYPEYNFIPVYWMASEDHDFEEIKSVNVFGKTLIWENSGAKGAVGRLRTDSMSEMINELALVIGDSENAAELITLFRKAYLKHETLADATRFLVHELFGTYGLVIIDPDDKRFKTEFIDIIKDDIKNQTNYKIVNHTIEGLSRIGIKPQVNPREINVFRLTDDRQRIESSTGEVLALPDEDYSPNVVLRPLYQQKLLPNVAYIGGPGEIAYWIEYKEMFDHHKILYPVLVPRDFALLTDEKTNSQLTKLGLRIEDVFKDTDLIIKEFLKENSGIDLSLKTQEDEIAAVYKEIGLIAEKSDPTLKAAVEAEMQKALNSLKNIESKLMRSEKQKQDISVNQIKKIKDKFLPHGILQERYENFAPYYLKYGKKLISDLKEAFDPFEKEIKILELK